MGWCSGTRIFDAICDCVLDEFGVRSRIDVEKVLEKLYKSLCDQDWDCESDSDYYTHPVVRAMMKRVSPELDWDDIEYWEKKNG